MASAEILRDDSLVDHLFALRGDRGGLCSNPMTVRLLKYPQRHLSTFLHFDRLVLDTIAWADTGFHLDDSRRPFWWTKNP